MNVIKVKNCNKNENPLSPIPWRVTLLSSASFAVVYNLQLTSFKPSPFAHIRRDDKLKRKKPDFYMQL